MKEKISVLTAALILVSLFAIHAGCGSPPEDPARRAFYYSVKALGGMEKTTGWKTRVQKGILEASFPGWGELKAEYTVHVRKPDMIRMDQDFSAYDHPFYYTYYGDGEDAWAVVNLNVRQSPRYTEMVREELRTADGLPYYYTACDTFFLVETQPSDSLLSGYDLERVGCVLEGDTVLFDLDTETHLPVRKIESAGTEQEILEDYRETDGIMMPFRLTRYRNGRERNRVKWEEIRFGVKIPDSLFLEFKPE